MAINGRIPLPDTLYPDGSHALSRDMCIDRVRTIVVDLPIKRPHKLSALTMAHQSCLLVEIGTRGGVVGWGEGVTPGGPWWSGESVETMRALIDGYIAPAIMGMPVDKPNALRRKMDEVAGPAPFAKGAVEIGIRDAAARAAGLSIADAFGGALRDGIPLRWALASGDLKTDIAEAEAMSGGGLATSFKIKGGSRPPAEDVAYCRALRDALGPDVSLQMDLNARWSVGDALRHGPEAMEYLDYLEQPVEGWNHVGLAALRRASCRVLADESLYSPQDALRLIQAEAADILALKAMKAGGLAATAEIAAVASAAGVACYGGSFMESSLGGAAQVQLFSTLPALTEGCEVFGAIWLATDISENGMTYRDGRAFAPDGPGHGVVPDPDRIARFKRD